MKSRNTELKEYILAERRKSRTYSSIGKEVGLSTVRARQLYVQVCREKRQEYFKTHPEEYAQWRENQRDKKWDNPPYVE
jgi:hypothetical protein